MQHGPRQQQRSGTFRTESPCEESPNDEQAVPEATDNTFEDVEELKAWLIRKGVDAQEENSASQKLFDKKYNQPNI